MKHYAGIDLHGTNNVIVVLDDDDRIRYQQRLRNELPEVLAAFAPFRETLQGIAVESTYNWYWLVDGLMDAGYVVHLAHVPALPQYSGLKHADDQHDARWLAHLLRLGLLPTGHIYPKADRPSGICSASAGSGCGRRLPWSSVCKVCWRGSPASASH
jgi:hypothetical protein